MRVDELIATEAEVQQWQRIAKGEDDVPTLPAMVDTPERREQWWEEVRKAFVKYARQRFLAESVEIRYPGLIAHVDGTTWYVWNGFRWIDDRRSAITRAIHQTMFDLKSMAKIKEHKSIHKAAYIGMKQAEISATEKILRAGKNSHIHEEFNQHTYCLAVVNGMLDLASGKLYPHVPEHMNTRLARTIYDPSAPCPKWLKFLDEIQDGDQEVIDYIQRLLGYSMTADISEHSLFLMYGTGANGKSVLTTVVREILGDYAIESAPDILIKKKNDLHPAAFADLENTRFATCSEVDEGGWMAEGLVKRLTGEGQTKARKMRENWRTIKTTWKLFMAVNHKPTIRGQDHAIWRRIKMIPFEVTIPPEKQNPYLIEELLEEKSGILNWMLEGCQKWLRGRLQHPKKVLAAAEEYRAEQDILGNFLNDCTMNDPHGSIPVNALYDAYKTWCSENSENATTKRRFMKNLREQKGLDPERRGRDMKYYISGHRLLPPIKKSDSEYQGEPQEEDDLPF